MATVIDWHAHHTAPEIAQHIGELTGKKPMVGNNVSHANNKTKRVFNPNLQTVRAIVGGATKRIRVCTRCLRSGLVKKAV